MTALPALLVECHAPALWRIHARLRARRVVRHFGALQPKLSVVHVAFRIGSSVYCCSSQRRARGSKSGPHTSKNNAHTGRLTLVAISHPRDTTHISSTHGKHTHTNTHTHTHTRPTNVCSPSLRRWKSQLGSRYMSRIPRCCGMCVCRRSRRCRSRTGCSLHAHTCHA